MREFIKADPAAQRQTDAIPIMKRRWFLLWRWWREASFREWRGWG